MIDVRIMLAFLWVIVMLIYLLGDVLRIFAGAFKPGEIDGKPIKDSLYLLMAVIMLIPILMIFLTLVLPTGAVKWTNIIVSAVFVLFNAVGLKGYKSFDVFLLLVSFVFNGFIIYYAFQLT